MNLRIYLITKVELRAAVTGLQIAWEKGIKGYDCS
ncbi:hypothetical protein LINPERPRIM_LOCUS24030 [Linum perenne]